MEDQRRDTRFGIHHAALGQRDPELLGLKQPEEERLLLEMDNLESQFSHLWVKLRMWER